MVTVFYFPQMLTIHMGDHIDLPSDLIDYDPNEYPHWHVFLTLHCGTPIDIDSLEENAKVIASYSVDEIKLATLGDLESRGLYVETSDYIV